MKILAATARHQSSNHFLTFRYWFKSLISLPGNEIAEHAPQFVSYFTWLVSHKLYKPASPSSCWPYLLGEFFKDYLSALLILYERLPCGTDHAGRRVREPVLERMLDPGLLALSASALPAKQVLEEGLPLLVGTAQHREDGGQRLFDSLRFENADCLLQDSDFLSIAEFIASTGKAKVQEITVHGSEFFSISVLNGFLDILRAKEFLHTLRLQQCRLFPANDSHIPGICNVCPNLRRLILQPMSAALTTYAASPDWLIMLLDKLPHLVEVEVPLSLAPRREHLDWLDRLEVLRILDPGDLLYGGYRLSNLRELKINMKDFSCISNAAPKLSGVPKLRHLIITYDSIQPKPPVLLPALCAELASHCHRLQYLSARAKIPLEGLVLLASSPLAASLEHLQLLRVCADLSGSLNLEAEMAGMGMLGRRFSALKHLQMSCDVSALTSVIPNQGPPPPLECLHLTIDNVKQPFVEEWLQVISACSATLRRLHVPQGVSDDHVDQLLRGIAPNASKKNIEELDLFLGKALTLAGVRKLLRKFKGLKRARLPDGFQWPEVAALGTAFHHSLREVHLMPVAQGRGEIPMPPSQACMKGCPIVVILQARGGDEISVRLTCALGKDDDMCDSIGWIVGRGVHGAVASRLRYLQSVHWELSQ